MSKVLVIDDEKEICRSLKGVLSDEGYLVKIASTPLEALKKVGEECFDLILLDVWFGKDSWDGVNLLEQLAQMCPLLPIIMISGHGTLELAVRAIKKGAYDFIEKPFDIDRLLISVKHALENCRLRRESILGESEGLQVRWPFPLDPRLKKLVATDARVLFLGERGVGKEQLAKEIHLQSARSKNPFLVLSSYALNTMSEEALFGVESGDGVREVGVLEYAQSGTVFIKNIHLLSPALQSQFARIWDAGCFYRVNGQKSVPLGARFLASALPEFLTTPSQFKKEFFDRITLNLHKMHPLRERREDIHVWVGTFLRQLSSPTGRSVDSLSSQIMRAFQVYDWPGNLTQMRNILENALLVSEEEELRLSDFSSEISGLFSVLSQDIFSLPLNDARSLFEYYYLSCQLAVAKGNVSSAARTVGMERSALHRKMKVLQQKADLFRKNSGPVSCLPPTVSEAG